MLRLCYEYRLPGQLSTFFETHSIYFMPVVNTAGFYEICEDFKKTNRLEFIRKNMKPDAQKQCKLEDDEVGVDLNRNYDWAFALDDEGSSPDPCAEDFRGRSPFSEWAT
jgi:hypothetical protein